MTPCLIALDWGTTSLRAYLLGPGGVVRDARAEPWGVMHVPDGDFAAAFDAITAGWRTAAGVPAIAAGMVGSAQGWREVPYVACPAGAGEIAAALSPVGDRPLFLVPGIARAGDPPDMMRGEETQVVGVLARHPALAERATLVLPGTHAKWVDVADGRVVDVATYLTGELFAVLGDHSILGRAGRGSAPGPDADAAFARGVCAARDSAGVAPLLFSARSLVLAGRLPAGDSLAYLSGLLIGDELRCALGRRSGDRGGVRPAALVGEPALCARYAAALRLFGVPDVPVLDGAAPAGLWRLAELAGFVGSASGAGCP